MFRDRIKKLTHDPKAKPRRSRVYPGWDFAEHVMSRLTDWKFYAGIALCYYFLNGGAMPSVIKVPWWG